MSTPGEDPSTSSSIPPSTSEPPSSSSQPPSSSSEPSSSQPSGSSSEPTTGPPPSTGDTTTPPSTTASSTSTVIVTTTDSSGVVYTTIPGALPSNTNAATQETPVGPIVGGVIGGIAALFFLALLIFLCRRRNRSKAQFEDGIFDPDHTIQRPVSQAVNPAFEIASDLPPGAARVTPYAYTPDPDNPAYDHGPEMRQSGYEDSVAPSSGAPSDYPLFPAPHAGGYGPPHAHGHGGGGIPAALLAGPAAAGVARSHTTATNSSGYPPSPYGGASYGPLSVSDYDRSSHAPSSPTRTTYSVPPSSNSAAAPGAMAAVGAPLNPRSAKEREAFANSHARLYNGGGAGGSHAGLNVANPGSPTEDRTGTPVVVHQDGGRVPEQQRPDDEIPPTYDSIPTNR